MEVTAAGLIERRPSPNGAPAPTVDLPSRSGGSFKWTT